MGKIKDNVVTKGFSGKFNDDLMFRQLDGKTYFAKRSVLTAPPSARQQEVRHKFKESTLYAAAALEDPETSQDYKIMAVIMGLKSAYMAAVTDYLSMPEVGAVFPFRYQGVVGNYITIAPKVPYKITEISVTIQSPDGTVIESGLAVKHGLNFRYIATVANPQVAGSKLVLIARDRADKESTFEKVLK